jgi:hypothetical protein
MNLLTGVHIQGDYNPGINAARICLEDERIKGILKISKQARQGQIITAFDSTPDLGTSELDLEDQQVLDFDKLGKEDVGGPCQTVFKDCPNEGRSEIVQLNVDKTSFWWEGVFKHTDVRWETRLIPISLLPQQATPAPKKKSDQTMTTEQMNALHEKIASGINHGLNAIEIVDTFQRRVTKAQLVRVIMELMERNH